MVVDGCFNVLVVCVLVFDVDRQKNRANSPCEKFSVEDLGFPGESLLLLHSTSQLLRGTPKQWGGGFPEIFLQRCSNSFYVGVSGVLKSCIALGIQMIHLQHFYSVMPVIQQI